MRHTSVTEKGVPEARRRILRLWQRGDQVYLLPQSLLLLFNQARWADCQQVPAYPLHKVARCYCAFPVSAKQLQQLAVAADSVVLYHRRGLFAEHVKRVLP